LYSPSHSLNSDPMGQGASTPRDESNTASSGNHERETGDGAQQQGAAGADPGRAAVAARLRRSRRIRNHIEHFARLGNRLMPSSSSSSSPSAAATSSSSSGPSSSNPSTIRGRVPGLRFRTRSIRPSGNARAHSSSPPRRGEPSSAQTRRRTMPLPRSTVVTRGPMDRAPSDIMEISPASTVTPQTRASSAAAVGVSAVPSRRSRMSRVRDSINLMSSELNSMLNRPISRRSAETRSGALDALNGTHRDSAGTETAARVTDSILSPVADEPSRRGAASIFGTGARDPQGVLDGLGNPGRIRPGEDQAAMLSRLLSVAAAATAASLVGDAEEAITQAQDVGGDNGGDGSFESFLRALRNGRLEAALRNGGNEMGGGNATDPNAENGVLSLNFFRMFRFGSTPGNNGEGEDGEEGGQGSRMVPVIIVGIRSVSPRESTDGDGPRPAPFFDALANLSIPSVHRGSRLGSAGAGGGGARPRPASMGSPIAPSRPLSNNDAASEYVSDSDSDFYPFAASGPSRAGPSRVVNPPERGEGSGSWRDSVRRRGLTSSDFLDLANPYRPPQATPAADGESGTTRERGSTTGAPNRPTAPEGTRSWIIYVLGGSYPENHPILTTPSLFTDVSNCRCF